MLLILQMSHGGLQGNFELEPTPCPTPPSPLSSPCLSQLGGVLTDIEAGHLNFCRHFIKEMQVALENPSPWRQRLGLLYLKGSALKPRELRTRVYC